MSYLQNSRKKIVGVLFVKIARIGKNKINLIMNIHILLSTPPFSPLN